MDALWYPGAFLVAIAALIVVHELGHFLAARWCNVKVLRFSVGFGKSLKEWRIGRDQTVWSIAAFPLGGYVKMLDEREGPVAPEEVGRAFNRQSVVRRMGIVVAGPLANLLLALLLYWAMYLHGVQDLKPILGAPPPDSVAAVAGITDGERVISAGGKPLATWSELRLEILDGVLARRSLTLMTVNPRGDIAYRRLDLLNGEAADLGDDPARALGLRIHRPPMQPLIGAVIDGSPAQQAGLKPDDLILSINEKPVGDWEDIVTAVQGAAGRSVQIELQRGSRRIVLQLTPQQAEENGRQVGRIGIAARPDSRHADAMLTLVRYGAMESLSKAAARIWDTSRLTLVGMARMITGDISWRNISGPVTIANYAGQSARMGIVPYLAFLAFISVSIGILNLLPVPVLDGGHLMYYLAELIKGSPVSERAQEFGQTIGFLILGLLMAFALYNDIHRLLSS